MKVMRGVWMCLGVWLGMAVAVAAESRHDDWVIRGQGADSPWLGDPENLIPEKYTDANTSGLGHREDDKRRVFGVLHNSAKPHDQKIAHEAEGQRHVLADHHRDQHAEHHERAGKRPSDTITPRVPR